MPKIVKGLNVTQVKNAKPKAKEYNLADGQGLYLRVKPNGTKLWLFNYQKPFTKQRSNLSLGTFPPVGLAQARTEREQYRELLAQAIDPKEHRVGQEQTEAHINTLKYVADKWFKVKESELTKDYAEDLYNSLDNHIFPKLGKKPIHKITAPETIKVLEPLVEAGKLEMIKRICQRLNMIMDYAVNTGIVRSNPLSGISKAFRAPVRTHFPTIKPDELPKLMMAINKAPIRLTTRCLIEFQLHTMVRPSEAAGARWDEIDFEKELWEIPAERMKKKRAHTIPLTSQTLAILGTMRPLSGKREYIFPSNINPKQHANSETVNTALKKRMGFKGSLVSHGLRSLSSSTLNEQAFDSDLIEVALAHQDKNTVRAAYNRSEYLERRRVMMQFWSNHIEEAKTLFTYRVN